MRTCLSKCGGSILVGDLRGEGNPPGILSENPGQRAREQQSRGHKSQTQLKQLAQHRLASGGLPVGSETAVTSPTQCI